MIIKGLPVTVYDVECFPNLFTVTIYHTELHRKLVFEISERTNWSEVVEKLINTFKHPSLFWCGYNNKHYDDAIINYIIDKYQYWLKNDFTYEQVTQEIFSLSNLIVNSESTEGWKQWKYAKNFKSMDLLTMLFSSKLRVGLKEMEVTMQVEDVDEYEGDFNKPVKVEDIDRVLEYNDHDVANTEELLNRLKKQIDLRLGIEEEYGVDVLSMDGVSIGKEILKTKYLQDTGKTWDEIKDLRSPCDMVELNKVILPIIEFKTPILQELLKEMKTLTVSPGINGWNKKFLFYDTIISIGVGGLHSQNDPEIIVPKEDEMLIDTDAASLYPTLLIEWGFVPKHLGKEFLNTYSNIKKERIEAKHNGNKVKNETLKLTLNSVTGLMQSEFSWLYSPEDVMKIRMNGQLILLMLAERLILATGCRVIQYNTDGIFILLKKQKYDIYQKTIREFEKIVRLSFEDEEFEKFIQFAVNDYIAIHKGYSETKDESLIKTKGMFINYPQLGKGLDCLIVPKALIKYFADDIPVEQTIEECKNIHDFISYQKIGKQFAVDWGNVKNINHINRFYYSIDGGFLMKREKDTGKVIKVDSNNGVTILNTIPKDYQFPKNINYQYYIGRCKKIINLLENVQLSLF